MGRALGEEWRPGLGRMDKGLDRCIGHRQMWDRHRVEHGVQESTYLCSVPIKTGHQGPEQTVPDPVEFLALFRQHCKDLVCPRRSSFQDFLGEVGYRGLETALDGGGGEALGPPVRSPDKAFNVATKPPSGSVEAGANNPCTVA